jgi:hypothetical protein
MKIAAALVLCLLPAAASAQEYDTIIVPQQKSIEPDHVYRAECRHPVSDAVVRAVATTNGGAYFDAYQLCRAYNGRWVTKP